MKNNHAFEAMVLPIGFIALGILLRLVPHPANVAPIAAMALFGGVYLDKKYALLIPLLAMAFSDIFLGFHNTMVFVYGSFVLTGLMGFWLRTHKTPMTIIGASLVSSILFYLITNFGVWFMGTMYPKNLAGLIDAYAMGIPFFRNTIVGDLLYTGLFFGAYEAVKQLVTKKAVLYGRKE